jgi:hypothetical protein
VRVRVPPSAFITDWSHLFQSIFAPARHLLSFILVAVKIAFSMQKRSRLPLLAAVTIVSAALGFIFVRNLIDFPVYYSAGQSLLSGRDDLYSPDFAQGQVMDYRYVPFFLVVFLPLWLLPYSIASYIWYVLSVLQIAGCVWFARRCFDASKSTVKIWIISVIIVAQYFIMILHYGNAHLLAIFLLFASFHFALEKKEVVAAILLSLSITLKLTPVFVLPYFALKRKWKFLFLVCVLSVVINASPSFYFGFEKNNELLHAWYKHVIVDHEFHEMNGPINLSLKGQLLRYFSVVDYSQRVDGDVRYPSINLFSLPTALLQRVWMISSLALFLFVLTPILKVSREKTGKFRTFDDSINQIQYGANEYEIRTSLELGLMICLMLIIGPLTSKIYFIALLWPVLSLSAFAFKDASPSAAFAKRVLLLVAVMNFVLPLLPGASIQRLFLVLGLDFYMNCLVTAAILYVLASRRQRFRQPPDEQQIQVLSATKKP